MVYVCALRNKEVSPLLREEGLYVPDKDTGVEAGLTDSSNCTTFTCWICCNDCDYWCWLVGLHVKESVTIYNCPRW